MSAINSFRTKGHPNSLFKTVWQKFILLDLFTKSAVSAFLLIIFITPIVIANQQVFFQQAATAANLIIDGNTKYQVMDGLGVNANSKPYVTTNLSPAIDTLVNTMNAQTWRVIVEDTQGWEDSPPPN